MARAKKAPCVDMKTDVFKDERFEVLAEIAGYANRYEAIGRMSALWAWCVDRGLKDAPEDCEGYAVTDAIAIRFLGPRAIDAILANGCDELALAVRRRDGRLYLRGTSEYVQGRRARAESASAGGLGRAHGDRDDHGRFVGETTVVQPDGTFRPAERTESVPFSQRTPASSSSSSSSSSGSETPPPARAIPPSTEYGARPGDHTYPAELLPLAEEIWRDLEAMRNEIAQARGEQIRPLGVFDRGKAELRMRLRESAGPELDVERARADAKHVIAVRRAEAVFKTGTRWLNGGMFTADSWRQAMGASPQSYGRRAPIRAAGAAPGLRIVKTVGDDDMPPIRPSMRSKP